MIMKKVVLFLINGFGIEQKDSFSIYNSELMPNLDMLTKENLFSSIETNSFILGDAYRVFSIETKKALPYSFMDTYSSKLTENPNFNLYLKETLNSPKIHVFYFLEAEEIFEHLKNLSNIINKSIYVHLVLTSNNIADYSLVEKLISKVNLELKTCKIGSISGLNIVKDFSKDYIAMLKNGIGEKWNEVSKKLEVLKQSKTVPCNTKPFFVNSDSVINIDDSILFYNYNYFDATNFKNNLNQIYSGKVFSMFPLKGINYPLYNYPISHLSLVNDLKKINAKALVITDSNNISKVNYYLNGLKNVNNDSLLFMKSEGDTLYNKNIISSILNDPQFNLIIVNHSVDDSANTLELKNKLKQIDNSIGIFKDICLTNNIIMVVSSLYGIKKEMLENQCEKKLVNFSSKVPVVILSENYNKKNYYLSPGSIIDLKHTCLKLINLEHKNNGLIRKKSYLSKLIKK